MRVPEQWRRRCSVGLLLLVMGCLGGCMRPSRPASCSVPLRVPVAQALVPTAAAVMPPFERTLQTEELVDAYHANDSLRPWPQFRHHYLKLLPNGEFQYDFIIAGYSGGRLIQVEGLWRIVGDRIWLTRNDEALPSERLELEITDAGLRSPIEYALWPSRKAARASYHVTLKRVQRQRAEADVDE